MMTLENVKRKVRACLAIAAPGSGATAPEATTARAMALKLLAAHGLEEKDIPQREAAPRRAPEPRQEYGGGFTVRVHIHGGVFGFGFDGGTATTGAW